MDSICQIKELYKVLYQFEKTFVERHGITLNEAMLLCCVRDGEAKTAGMLCEYIGLSAPRVSKVITTVEKKGYICRRIGSHDHRQMLFSLTEEGAAKIRQMQEWPMSFDDLFTRLKSCLEGA